MVRLYKHSIAHAALMLVLIDIALLLVAGDVAWRPCASQIGMTPGQFVSWHEGALP